MFQSLVAGVPVFTRRPVRTPDFSIVLQESGPAMLPALYHTHHVIAVPFDDGHAVERVDARSMYRTRLDPGDVAIIPAGSGQQVVWPTGARCLYLHIHPRMMGGSSVENHLRSRDSSLGTHGRTILDLVQDESKIDRVAVAAVVGAIVERLRSRYEISPTDEPWIGDRRIGDVLERLRLESIGLSVAALAAECGLTRSHFTRRFRRLVGASPHALALGSRLEWARMLVRERRLPLSRIALECGFADQAHFSRAFKQQTGITPAVFATLRP
jgi:AraC family transcriptional regulator